MYKRRSLQLGRSGLDYVCERRLLVTTSIPGGTIAGNAVRSVGFPADTEYMQLYDMTAVAGATLTLEPGVTLVIGCYYGDVVLNRQI